MHEKLRILMIVPLPPPYGGIAIQAEALYEQLRRRNWDVIIHNIRAKIRKRRWQPTPNDFLRITKIFATVILKQDSDNSSVFAPCSSEL